MQTLRKLVDIFSPENYQLSINIEREARSFSGIATISGSVIAGNEDQLIVLHAKDLFIESVSVDGKKADFSHGDSDELLITQKDIRAGKHIVVIAYTGKINDGMHGMYPCYFNLNGEKKELIATQFESHHAREVFPCVDEPAAKATFDLTLTTETGVTVLGNLHPTSQNEQDDRLVTTFGTTPRMSTYLLAWVYGDLHKKTAHTNSGVEVNVYAATSQPAESLDFALEHAVKTIEFFDDYFETPYPLPKSNHVALPDFSSGAMENWGLVTYRESCLLADPKHATIDGKKRIALVVSHELSHQWFGNLVTMKWWNDLWLNESFATLMEYVALDAIHPEWNPWLDFASHESLLALRRDAIDGVQSVQVDVHHPDEISSLFDGAIVYAKGSRLMRMCQAYIGEKAFQHGLKSYFAEFAYRNTEANDLWKHLSKASGKDISSFMNTWISQSGYPLVTVSNDGLRQEQFFIGPHQESSQIWPIPLHAESEEDVPELLETREITMPISEEERLNVGDSSHFIAQYSPDHLERIISRHDLTDLDKLQLLHEQTLLIRAGISSSAQIIDLLPKFIDSTSDHVWDIIAVAFGELKKFVEEDAEAEKRLRNFAGKLARSQYERLGWTATVGEPSSDTRLRNTILGFMAYSHDKKVLEHIDNLFAQGYETLDPELRPIVLSSVVSRTEDLDLAKSLFGTYSTTSSPDMRDDILAGLTSAKEQEIISYLVKNLTDTKCIRPQDNATWFAYLVRNRYSRTATWQWLQDNWSWIEQNFGSDKSYDYYPRYAASGLMNQKQRDEYKAFFEPLRKQPALTRVIDLGLLEIDSRIEILDRDSGSVKDALSNK